MGFVFWGVFIIYGALLLAYIIWMHLVEKNHKLTKKEE